MLFRTVLLLLSIITGISLHNREASLSRISGMASLLWESLVSRGASSMTVRRIAASNRDRLQRMLTHRQRGAPITSTSLFGERPHFFTPPSDMEQYRIKRANRGQQHLLTRRPDDRRKIVSRILMGEAPNQQDISGQHYTPYPNDPPHTFPAIKARTMFTRVPKRFREVYVDSADPVERTYVQPGMRLRVPLKHMEERYRTVYETGQQQGGLEITVNSMPTREMRRWEQLGYVHNKTYDFHGEDGMLSPPLYRSVESSSHGAEIWEEAIE